MSVDRDLYQLLPEIYRRRDQERGRPLETLLGVIQEQVDLVEADIARLYENWFIETCQDWVAPYIGELIGYRTAHDTLDDDDDPENEAVRRRGRVLIPKREIANTLRHRRRAGTLAALEELAWDVTGWPARAVEYATLVARTREKTVAGSSPAAPPGFADLRAEALERPGGPGDNIGRTADVRGLAPDGSTGRFNPSSVGLYVWPLRLCSVHRALAAGNSHPDFGLTYTCDGQRGGRLRQIYALQSEDWQTPPRPIGIRDLAEHVAELYGPGKSLCIWKGDDPIANHRIVAADLVSNPPYAHVWDAGVPSSSAPTLIPKLGRDVVAVDPVAGAIAFGGTPPTEAPDDIRVTYHYAQSGDVGPGAY